MVGRRFSNAATELALASYPGFYLTSPPGDGTAYGVFWPTLVARSAVDEVVVHARRPARSRSVHRPTTSAPGRPPAPPPTAATADSGGGAASGHGVPGGRRPGGCRSGPSIGARSGDKGGNANVGLWARRRGRVRLARLPSSPWTRFRQLLPEAATLDVDRYEFANLLALNFVVHGLLGEGVASSTRPDPQAKSLGEYLRSRLVDIPVACSTEHSRPQTGRLQPTTR